MKLSKPACEILRASCLRCSGLLFIIAYRILFEYLERNICGIIFYLHVITNKKLAGLDTYGTRFSAFHIFSSGLQNNVIFPVSLFLFHRSNQFRPGYQIGPATGVAIWHRRHHAQSYHRKINLGFVGFPVHLVSLREKHGRPKYYRGNARLRASKFAQLQL